MIRRGWRHRFRIVTRSFWHIEAIAGAVDCFQIPWLIWFQFNFLPDSPHIHINRTRGYVRGVAPNRIKQLVAREDTPGVTDEIVKQLELSGSGGDFLPVNLDRHSRRINFQVSDGHYGWQRFLSAPKERPHAGD